MDITEEMRRQIDLIKSAKASGNFAVAWYRIGHFAGLFPGASRAVPPSDYRADFDLGFHDGLYLRVERLEGSDG